MSSALLFTNNSINNNLCNPVPKEEEDILAYLEDIKLKLSKLKQNREKYLNSKEVQTIYQNVLTKVRELDNIRKLNHLKITESADPAITVKEQTSLIHNNELHNKVDCVLDDVFQVLSLCFLTVGLKNSAPATYSSLSTVQKLLEHLDESNIFTNHDLRPIKERLDEISKIVERCSYQNISNINLDEEDFRSDEDKQNKIEEDLLLRAKLQHCIDEYHQVHSKLEEIHPDLQSIIEKLYCIRRSLLSLAAPSNKQSLSKDSLNKLNDELTELESHRDENGKFKSLETNKVEEMGQNALASLLDNCHDLLNDLSNQASKGIELDPKLQPIYDELIDIKTNLANLMVTRRWTLRETDLFLYQKKLAEIDNLRVNGKFPTESGDSNGQSIILYLLRRCYAIIYKLLESSEPVSESLQPIHNQLSTARRCLLELKRMGGVNSERELYPYQLKLASLDDSRTDGKFYDSNGNIPEGQGTLNALLAECFDIMHELEVEAEERSSSRDEGDDIVDQDEIDRDVEEADERETQVVDEQPTARSLGDTESYEEESSDQE